MLWTSWRTNLVFAILGAGVTLAIVFMQPRHRTFLPKPAGNDIGALPGEWLRAGRYSDVCFSHSSQNRTSLHDLEVIQFREQLLSKNSFQLLVNLPELIVLDISGCQFDQADLAQLTKCKRLRVLVLNGCALKSDGIVALSKSSIEGISIVDSVITDEDFTRFHDISSLRWLVVGKRSLPIPMRNSFYGVVRISETMDCCYGLPKFQL